MFRNRVRLPFFLSRAQFPIERNVFRKADGTSKMISAIIRNTYEGNTDQLPEDWHRKLVIALAHDEVTIEDQRLLTDVVLDSEYEIEWQDFLNYPVAPAKFTVQTSPFNASNTNCQTCSEITQLETVDDYSGVQWQENNSYTFPQALQDNDTICCYPFVIELISYNTLYFTNVLLDEDGILTATVKASVPTLDNVLIGTYRVTCPDGSYDEANVYTNIKGTLVTCEPIDNLEWSLVDDDDLLLSWDVPTPAPSGGYNYALYLTSNPSSAITSGNVPTNYVTIDGSLIVQGESYTAVIISNCGEDNFSVPVSIVFTWTGATNGNCGEFTITHLAPSPAIGNITYFNCQGAVTNRAFYGNQTFTICMLMDATTHVPTYFATSSGGYITYLYIDLC